MSKPVMTFKVSINTAQAQYGFTKLFKDLDQALFFASAVLPKTDKEAAELMVQSFEQKIEGKTAELTEYANKLKSVIAQEMPNTTLCDYTEVFSRDIEVSSSLSLKFLEFLTVIDECVRVIDTAWISRLISDEQRNQFVDDIQQNIFEIAHSTFRLRKQNMRKINHRKMS